MLLAEIAATSERVRSTRSRTEKIEALTECLRSFSPAEAEAGVSFLAGEPRQSRLGIGYAAVQDVAPVPAKPPPTVTVKGLDDAFQEMADVSGAGSAGRRRELLEAVLTAATAEEQRLIRGLIVREVRQGALEGVLIEAVARATAIGADAVRRAVMMAGDVKPVAAALLQDGPEALERFRLTLFVPLRPMLAQPADSLADAVENGDALVEHKLDGARIQVHRDGDRVEVYTRNLRVVTARVPEIVQAVLSFGADAFVLDGEAIALDREGRPLPFQVTMGRFGTQTEAARSLPLHPFFFDILHVDGEDVIDLPAGERLARLDAVVPEAFRVGRMETGDPAEAEAFFAAALAAGQEGVVVKDPAAPYAAGRRGAAWRKVKPAHTLDLVILAAEWGSGRRRGWLSNLHLGARDPDGGFVMLGKTFKGLTDAMLEWQTERLLELEVERDRHVVVVEPRLVAEIAFDGVQASPRYPGGMALRFARVKGYRPDKDPSDADTIGAVREIFGGG